MYNIQLTDFRCFEAGAPIEIKPLTFLVGENSAGKTSFLAGLRFLLESFSRSGQNPFNRDPYFLGGFEQIVHYHGGPISRAKNFTLALQINSANKAENPLSGRPGKSAITHQFQFGKGYPQPELENYSFFSEGISVGVSLTKSRPTFKIGNTKLDLSMPLALSEGGPPSSFVKENITYLRYVIDGLQFDHMPDERGAIIEKELEKISLSKDLVSRALQAFAGSYRLLAQDVFASAPVRSQPTRTYTPSEITPSSEGSHVPLELARIKRESLDDWKILKQRLGQFGKASGLFSEIDVRQLGKTDIDPFQLLVKVSGPSMNIVDVGYGVSQALPIVYQLQGSKHTTFLLQQPEVHLHPRAQAEIGSLLIQSLSRRVRGGIRVAMVVETHSDYIIDRVRIGITEGLVKNEDVTIVYFDKERHSERAQNIYFDEKGDVINPPPGYRSFFMQEQARLFGV